MKTDPQAQALYQAQWMMPYWYKCPRFSTIQDAQYRLREIQTSRIWADKVCIPAGLIELQYEQTDVFAGLMGFAFHSWHHPYIKLSQHGMQDAVLIHEIAHYVTDVQSWGKAEPHGIMYANVLLNLFKYFVNVDTAKDLCGWFQHAGVQYG